MPRIHVAHRRPIVSRAVSAAACLLGAIACAGPATVAAQDARAVQYRATFADHAHHWMDVEVTFPSVPPGPLPLRMARSSPGRYALHEFAKNVFTVSAFDGSGKALAIARPNAHQWNVEEHDGTVVVRYRVFGDRADGTYLQVDTSHAHINAPAAWMWARGFEDRPVQVRFEQPPGENWSVATQLLPTVDPLAFTAPNLQYFMDSPVEFGEGRIFEFALDDGQQIRVALHHRGSDAEALRYVEGVQAIVAETKVVFGEYPTFDGGTYTFLADYLPWADGDGMEHRNSTVLTSQSSLRTNREGLLGTVSHEFFHAWNVERIRPDSLEPFDFERANMSDELWLAEGFTSYYGDLVMHRAGIDDLGAFLRNLGGLINSMLVSPGDEYRSAVEMSRLAPFVDAARAVDPTTWDNTFVSYYTYGAALALALDLELRARSEGAVTLDHFMRAMWLSYGKPGSDVPGIVQHPYDVDGARRVLAEVSGDAAFADDFFARHVQGTEPLDWPRLLATAGLEVRAVNADGAYLGATFQEGNDGATIAEPTQLDGPAYRAGLDVGDTLLELGGVDLRGGSLGSALRRFSAGDTVPVRFRRRDGSEATSSLTLAAEPYVHIQLFELSSGKPTPAQLRLRNEWLGSQR